MSGEKEDVMIINIGGLSTEKLGVKGSSCRTYEDAHELISQVGDAINTLSKDRDKNKVMKINERWEEQVFFWRTDGCSGTHQKMSHLPQTRLAP